LCHKKRAVSLKFCGKDKFCSNVGIIVKENLKTVVMTKENAVSVNSEANAT
jgi:hypothetical protein